MIRSKIVIMEEESFGILTKKIEKLTSEVKQINTQYKSGFKEHWLTTEEVCKILNVCKRTLQDMRNDGTIKYSKMGRKIYYKAIDIELLLEENYGI